MAKKKNSNQKLAIFQAVRKRATKSNDITEKKHSKDENVHECEQ